MELDLQRTLLEGYQPILDTALTQEATTESIVPDSCPDVSRIVCTSGTGYITAKQVQDRSVKIMGTACLQVLYVPEGESVPRALTVNVPFQCVGDYPNIGERDQIHAAILSVTADTRLINPRKLFVKAEVKVRLNAYSHTKSPVVCDMAEENPSIQKQKTDHTHHSIFAVLEKPFSFSDTLRQSSSKPTIEELLTYRMEPITVDSRYIGMKMICKGVMMLSILYRSGTEVIPAQFELPFSQIMDFEGSFEEGDPTALVALKQVECDLRDGELDVTVDALIQATIWSHRTVTMLGDVYSTAMPLDVERASVPVCTDAERNSRRESARKFCESGIPAKLILNCSVSMGALTVQKKAHGALYSTEAAVDILYLSEDDALCGVSYTVPLSCEIDVAPGYTCSCQCRPVGEAIAVPVTGGIEVRLEGEFSWMLTRVEAKPCVTSVKKSSVDLRAELRPSVIIRMVGKNETLWDIAKACGSTIQDICTANMLSSETAECGAMLLIPVNR